MAQIPADQTTLPTPQAAMSVASPRQESRTSIMFRTMQGQAEEQAGAGFDSLANQFQQEQDRLNVTQAEDAMNKVRQVQQNLTLGDNGFAKLRGSAAVNQPVLKNYSENFDTAVQSISDGLQNDEQRQLFAQRAAAVKNQFTGDILQHLAKENDVYHKQVTGATIDTETQDAALHYDNPASVQGNLARIGAAVDAEVQRNGLNPSNPDDAKIIADEKMKAVSGLHAAVVSTAIDNGNTTYAQKWLDEFKGQMDTKVLEGLQGALKAGVTKDQALSLALDVKSQTTDIGQQEKILDQRFREGKINADVHNAALQQLRADNAQRRSEQSEQDRSVLGNIWDMKTNNPNATLNDIPASTMAYIKQRGLGMSVDNILKSDVSTDNPRLFLDLMGQANTDPAGFMNQDITKYYGQLSREHQRQLESMTNSISRNDTKSLEANKLVHETVGDVKASLLSSGFNLNPKPNTDDAKKLDGFLSNLHDSIVSAQQNGPISRDDARNIALGMMKTQALSGTGFSIAGHTFNQTTKPSWQMTPEEKSANWDIPNEDRSAITASLQKNGMPINEQNIQRMYKRKQGVFQ